MALNALELGFCARLIRTVAATGHPPRVLLLGYPDLLCTPDSLRAVGVQVDWERLPKRTPEVSRAVWIQHGREVLAELPVLETKGVLRALGAEPVVTDAIPWGGEDHVLDLNLPLEPKLRAKLEAAEIIVDPGTLEHCFNIAQAFDNVDQLLQPRGFVYHQAAAAFPNHGFWSISPTAFFDFYQSRGYDLGRAYYWEGWSDSYGFVPNRVEAPPFETKAQLRESLVLVPEGRNRDSSGWDLSRPAMLLFAEPGDRNV